MTCVILDPAVGFDAVAARFAGWDGGPTDRRAWLAGEPIGARWARGGAEVSYSANPAIGLRVLEGAAATGVALPLLTPARARDLAGSADTERALLGITAAGLYRDLDAVGQLEALGRDPRPEVRAAAELALRRIGVAVLALGADRIAERRRAAPDRDPVLGLLGPASTRRQLIRWLAAEPPEDRDRQLELVRAALADPDWEVRWSAVIAAATLGLSELALDVRRCRPAEGAHRADRQILEALREVAGRQLTGGRSDRPGADHLAACLSGEAAERDRAFLLLTALRRPLPVSPTPTAAPGFCAVPAILHWAGDPELPENPLRAAVPATFAIAAELHGEAAAADVPARLGALSRELGLPLRLPRREELELAVRGPDGRRHPWGNGRERGSARTRSPWGLHDPVAGPEWVDAGGEPLALGDGVCAGPLSRPAVAGLRPVVA